MSSTQDAWLSLWLMGWSLVPIEPRGKRARVAWSPYQQRHATKEELGEWLREWPDANPGIVTGRVSGVVVLDIDGPDGILSLAQMGGLPDTPKVKTAKGYHYFFAYPHIPPNQRVITKAGIAQGVDIRGDGGYVVAAGSVHESGVVYQWEVSPDDCELAHIPEWLHRLVVVDTPDPLAWNAEAWTSSPNTGNISDRDIAYVRAALNGEVQRVADAPNGTKHDTLLSASAKLGGYVWVLGEAEIEQALFGAVESRARDKRAALKTIRDGMDFGSRSPRTIPEGHDYAPRPQWQEPPIEAYVEDVLTYVEYETQETPKKPPRNPQETRWVGVPIGELPDEDETTQWILEGYIAPKMLTLFTGTWKSGKSTLLTHIYKALDGTDYEFAGIPVTPSKVLVISEENVRHWRERRQDLTLGNHITLLCKPFSYNPTKRDWQELLGWAAKEVEGKGYDLVVFDSLHNLWSVENENDAAQVKAAITGMNAIAEAGAAVVLVGHPSKAEQGEGKATRGSGVLPSMVDIIIEMRRNSPDDRMDTMRVLTGYSRFDETPAELVLDYGGVEGYSSEGTKGDVARRARVETIMSLLPKEAPGVTAEELLRKWPNARHKPFKRTLVGQLEYMAREGISVIKKDDRYYHAETNKQWERR